MSKKIKVAIAGLGFGAEFIPIYQRHPNAQMYAICQRNEQSLNQVVDEFGVNKCYASYEAFEENELVLCPVRRRGNDSLSK